MMGQHTRSEPLFYYFRLEDEVPETHLLRLIEKHISFAFVREKLKDSYSETGRPSIDPELLLRILSDRLPLRHHQRAETGGGTAHASGVALVHGLGLRSRDPPSLDLFQEPARTVSGVEVIRAVIRADRAAVCGGGTGERGGPSGRWQLRGSERRQGEPHSTGTIGGGGPGPSDRASVSAGSGRAEPGGGTGSRTGAGIDAPIPIPLMPRKAARQLDSATTTTT